MKSCSYTTCEPINTIWSHSIILMPENEIYVVVLYVCVWEVAEFFLLGWEEHLLSYNTMWAVVIPINAPYKMYVSSPMLLLPFLWIVVWGTWPAVWLWTKNLMFAVSLEASTPHLGDQPLAGGKIHLIHQILRHIFSSPACYRPDGFRSW